MITPTNLTQKGSSKDTLTKNSRSNCGDEDYNEYRIKSLERISEQSSFQVDESIDSQTLDVMFNSSNYQNNDTITF